MKKLISSILTIALLVSTSFAGRPLKTSQDQKEAIGQGKTIAEAQSKAYDALQRDTNKYSIVSQGGETVVNGYRWTIIYEKR